MRGMNVEVACAPEDGTVVGSAIIHQITLIFISLIFISLTPFIGLPILSTAPSKKLAGCAALPEG
jgi:hypothetical protein